LTSHGSFEDFGKPGKKHNTMILCDL